MTRGKKVALGLGIGCLGLPILLALIAGVTALVGQLMYGNDPPTRSEETKIALPLNRLPGAVRNVTPGRDLPEIPPPYSADHPVHLRVELEEGEFDIVPGEPGSALRAEGEFDPRDYELTQEAREGDDGPEVTIRFRRKASFLALLFHGEDNGNKVTVTIPRELPTALALHVHKGESHMDLGGLTLTSLDADMAMGDHLLRFSAPVEGSMDSAVIRASMGDMKILDLGNAHARTLGISASMGDMRVSFAGDWPESFATKATMRFKMGDVRVDVPAGVRIAEGSSSNVTLAEGHMEALRQPQDQGPSAPSLEMHVSMMFGEIHVNHD